MHDFIGVQTRFFVRGVLVRSHVESGVAQIEKNQAKSWIFRNQNVWFWFRKIQDFCRLTVYSGSTLLESECWPPCGTLPYGARGCPDWKKSSKILDFSESKCLILIPTNDSQLLLLIWIEHEKTSFLFSKKHINSTFYFVYQPAGLVLWARGCPDWKKI